MIVERERTVMLLRCNQEWMRTVENGFFTEKIDLRMAVDLLYLAFNMFMTRAVAITMYAVSSFEI